MRELMRSGRRATAMAAALALVLSACGGGGSEAEGSDLPVDDAPGDTTDGGAASGAPYRIGWLTDASSVTRGTYYPEYEGAKLFFEQLNEEGGVNGRPVELLVEDMQIDQELAVSLSTRLIEDRDVLMLAGGTVEGRMPAIFEVARTNGVPFLTGHSARPDMFPEEPDPLLFTAGNVFEAMSDARVSIWPRMFADEFPDGGEVACYIHESPAAVAVCDRWLENLDAQTDWTPGPIVTAPLQTSDFGSYVQPIVEAQPDAFFNISIASHAIGVAVAARNGGYAGPIVFSMTATPEPDIDSVIGQVGGDNIYAISNITSIDETVVPEIQRIVDAAETYGTELEPSSATVNGWLMGMIIADSLERCGEDCDTTGLRDALEATDLDTAGLTGGPITYSPTDHVGMRYWTAYKYDANAQELVRIMDDWVEFDPATDLLAPLATE